MVFVKKPAAKSKSAPGGIQNIRQVVRKLKLRAVRDRAKVSITTIGKQRVHAVDSPKQYIDHPTVKDRKIVVSQLQGFGNVSKMAWSGSTHGDQVEQARYKFVQKTVVIPEVDAVETQPKEIEVKKIDVQGSEVDVSALKEAKFNATAAEISEQNGA